MRSIVARTVALDKVPEKLWPAMADLLDGEERARASRFAFERHRRQFVAAHALKRLMLSAVAGVPARSWQFERGANGKPRVGPGQGPMFNISHCDGLVACAVSADLEVGIDVEPIWRTAPLALAERHFAVPERRWLASLPETERSAGFLAVWTLKEAFIKATGQGLARPLCDFAVTLDPPGVAMLDGSPADLEVWRFLQRRVDPGHILALAWRGEGVVLSLGADGLETLIAGAWP